jgi:hypothetical protein
MDARTSELVTGVMSVMDPTGHTKVSWNCNDATEVRAARDTFNQMIAQGYSAFRVSGFGGGSQRGERMSEFDPDAEAVILVPHLQGG